MRFSETAAFELSKEVAKVGVFHDAKVVVFIPFWCRKPQFSG